MVISDSFLVASWFKFYKYLTKRDDNMNKLCKRHLMYLWIAYFLARYLLFSFFCFLIRYLLACLICLFSHA